MVKSKLEKKIKQDPVTVITFILIFVALLLGVLVYMHQMQNEDIKQIRSDIERIEASRNAR